MASHLSMHTICIVLCPQLTFDTYFHVDLLALKTNDNATNDSPTSFYVCHADSYSGRFLLQSIWVVQYLLRKFPFEIDF